MSRWRRFTRHPDGLVLILAAVITAVWFGAMAPDWWEKAYPSDAKLGAIYNWCDANYRPYGWRLWRFSEKARRECERCYGLLPKGNAQIGLPSLELLVPHRQG